MATDVQSTRPSSRPNDLTEVENTPTPVITPAGGVAVYDRDADTTTNPSLRSAAIDNDLPPAEVRSSGSMLTWVISAIVLILLVYFLLQFIF